jgi:hypothetical protein
VHLEVVNLEQRLAELEHAHEYRTLGSR